MPNRRELGYVSAGSTSTVYVSTGIYGRATGGIGSPTAVTISGVDYEYLTFNATGTLTVTTAGWFDYLLVGGGVGSAYKTSTTQEGAGGGSGQVTTGSIYLTANQTVTIGAGAAFGIWNSASARIAGDTTVTVGTGYQTIFALGGVNKGQSADGSGDDYWVCTSQGCHGAGTNTRFINNALYGYKGGNGASSAGGGGGGFTGAGAQGVTSTTGGVGGAGYDVSVFIGGSTLIKATGGGGGGTTAGGAGGNSSACGNAGSNNTTPSSASANTGAGGGAGVGTTTTGNGGSGIAYIRWKTS